MYDLHTITSEGRYTENVAVQNQSGYTGLHDPERCEDGMKGRGCVCLFVCGRTCLKAPGRAVTYWLGRVGLLAAACQHASVAKNSSNGNKKPLGGW